MGIATTMAAEAIMTIIAVVAIGIITMTMIVGASNTTRETG
jgi:hypothetical protein